MDPGSTQSHGPAGASSVLAGGFEEPTEDQWLELVHKVLKGAPLSKLDSTTPGGVTVHPLYTQDSAPAATPGLPGESPFLRGAPGVEERAGSEDPGWAMRTEVAAKSPAEAAALALEALERGAKELTLVVGGTSGVPISSTDDMDASLAEVMLDLAPVYLRSGDAFVDMAERLVELWERRGVPAAGVRGGFGADPIGTLATTGRIGIGIEAALGVMADLSARTAATHPGVRAVSVDSTAFADAGANEVDELAIVLSVGAAYLRACSAAGMDVDDACRQIEITVTTDADVFTGVAKLRVLRRLWSVVAESCGAAPTAAAPLVHVRTAETMMTVRDPWVNLLRVTAASLAAALGGADSLATLPYDDRLGEHGELGRRMARNTQLLLAEESNVARVVDPMGGSWYLESLTEELADAAWARFGELEAAGGMPSVLLDGSIARRISDGVTERMARVATRRQPITGVSEFPDLGETRPTLAPAGAGDSSGADIVDDGTTATVIAPFAPVHWSAAFEELRDRSDAHLDATGSRPTVFLVNVGPVAKHTARATYAQNFYAAGGVEAVTSAAGSETGFESAEQATADVEEMQPDLVCICSTDDIYAEHAVEYARALTDAGVRTIHLAGKPGELEDALRAAGVQRFIHIGVDLIEVLDEVHATIGTPEVDH